MPGDIRRQVRHPIQIVCHELDQGIGLSRECNQVTILSRVADNAFRVAVWWRGAER